MKLRVELPLPPRELSPNHTVGSKFGRMGRARKTKKYRFDAGLAVKIALAEQEFACLFPWAGAMVQATFYFKDARRRDKDNLLASIKAAFDGLQDAGVIQDDCCITHQPVLVLNNQKDPHVLLEIWR